MKVISRNLGEVHSDKPIHLVMGRLCSGKGTFCEHLLYDNGQLIVTSDIVRSITNIDKRSELCKTAYLDQTIADRMIEQIDTILNSGSKVVVDGIRQVTIVQRLIDNYGLDNIELTWLDVDKEVLKYRFSKRKDAKDDQTFEELFDRDEQLGVRDLEQWLYMADTARFVDNG